MFSLNGAIDILKVDVMIERTGVGWAEAGTVGRESVLVWEGPACNTRGVRVCGVKAMVGNLWSGIAQRVW